MKRSLRLAALLAAFSLPAFAQVNTWQIDPAHSNAQFAVRHLAISTVRGEFTKIAGQAQIDEKDITKSQIEVTIDATTLNTRVPDRDKDVKSPNFLDVAQYPAMTFKSKRIAVAGEGKLKLIGDLTIHGVTKEVTFEVESLSAPIKDPWGNQRRGAAATAKISRQDFGVSFNKTMQAGELVVGNDVTITLDIELVKKG
jgi:polyisoprenoid-binding protein YceI